MSSVRTLVEAAFRGTSPSRLFSGQSNTELDEKVTSILVYAYCEMYYHMLNQVSADKQIAERQAQEWVVGVKEVLEQELEDLWSNHRFPPWRKNHALELLTFKLSIPLLARAFGS